MPHGADRRPVKGATGRPGLRAHGRNRVKLSRCAVAKRTSGRGAYCVSVLSAWYWGPATARLSPAAPYTALGGPDTGSPIAVYGLIRRLLGAGRRKQPARRSRTRR